MFAPHFDELESIAHSELQDEFASKWTFKPMVLKPNLPVQPDSTRASVPFYGTFSWRAKMLKLGLQEMEVTSRDPCLQVHRDCMPAVVRRGDQVVRCSDGLTFEVVDVMPDGYSGVEINLVQLGKHSK